MNSLKPLRLMGVAAGEATVVAKKVRCSYMDLTIEADAATYTPAADIYTVAIASRLGHRGPDVLVDLPAVSHYSPASI